MRARALTLAGAALAASLVHAGAARASSVLEVPDNGSEQMGRGGAWVARASDPLAAFYNPAGLAGQDTRLTLQANVNIGSACFTRTKAQGDTTNDGVAQGGQYPQACSDGKPFPNPQLAFNYRLTDRVGLGVAVLGPSAVGNLTYPDGGPQRYLLLKANTLLLTPTIGVGWEPVDNLRVGAAFLWGIANFDFSNDSYATNSGGLTPSQTDITAELKVKNMFVPGLAVGTIWSPTDNLDVAGWYKWMSQISTKGDVVTTVHGRGGTTFTTDTSQSNCGEANVAAGTCGPNSATLKVNIPMEAKVGIRYHKPRKGEGVPAAHHRDPMAQDVFDVELDLTWANDSAFDAVKIGFPGTATGGGIIPVAGAGGGDIPPNADQPHQFKDVYGARLGGDWVILPNQLSVRAGTYYETQAANSQYANIDFAPGSRLGFAAGGTYRVPVGSHALDLMVGLGHTFIGSLTNSGPNGILAVAGTDCYAAPGSLSAPSPNGPLTCSDGSQRYRYPFPINLGTFTYSFTAINIGASYRF
jgi:long-chain fatty acid transport protein